MGTQKKALMANAWSDQMGTLNCTMWLRKALLLKDLVLPPINCSGSR